MWKIERVSATNLMSFAELDYTLQSNVATLIFGHNEDNGNRSNGSGKSSLIEAIAISLTGSPLKKVKSEELIKDGETDCSISLSLTNLPSGDTFDIVRNFKRKGSQTIQLTYNGKEMVVESVDAYNSKITEIIGVSKDEILNYFILSKHRFQSFLEASDRDKKEIINRFSNANKVDEAIEVAKNNVEEEKENLYDVEKVIAAQEGVKETLLSQIEEVKDNEEKRNKDVAERKEALRAENRNAMAEIIEQEKATEELKTIAAKYKEKKDNIINLDDRAKLNWQTLKEVYNENNCVDKYINKSQSLNEKLKSADNELEELKDELARLTSSMNEKKEEAEKVSEEVKAAQADNKKQDEEVEAEIKRLAEEYKAAEKLKEQHERVINETQEKALQVSNKLNGSIICPKCSHEFVLADENFDVEEGRKGLARMKEFMEGLEREIDSLSDEMKKAVSLGKEARNRQMELGEELREILNKERAAHQIYTTACAKVDFAKTDLSQQKDKKNQIQRQVNELFSNAVRNCLSEISDKIAATESKVKQISLNIAHLNQKIEYNKEHIEQIGKISSADIIANIQSKLKGYVQLLKASEKEQAEINAAITNKSNVLDSLVDFKTHLANTKVTALSIVTNDFLSQINSVFRVEFKGYTKLASGKVRDKISIEVKRDGELVGSFTKLSEGERAEINLSTILAMNKLINANGGGDGGLDLIILDEILDACDEIGLSNMITAINKLGITALIVSHGKIAENYEHKLKVVKSNGESIVEQNV